MHFLDNVWSALNQLASQPAGLGVLVTAGVTLGGSLLQFFRVFLEHRSSKLVSRDTRRREHLHQTLKPLIDEVENLSSKLDGFAFQLWMHDESVSDAKYGYAKRLQSDMRSIDEWGQFMISQASGMQRFPLIRQTTLGIVRFMQRFYREIDRVDFYRAHDWMRHRSAERRRVFHDFHRAVEHVLFGTSAYWAAWMAMKRAHYGTKRPLQRAWPRLTNFDESLTAWRIRRAVKRSRVTLRLLRRAIRRHAKLQ
jgi:hypothetical protein